MIYRRYRHGCDPPKPNQQSRFCLTNTLLSQPGSEATRRRWIKNERAVRLLKFLAAGLPSFLLAIPANYWLAGWVGLAKPVAYAIVLAGQVTLNFFLNRVFVFEKRGKSMVQEFVPFVVGILGFRVADWLAYVLLVEVYGLYYLAVQLGNVLVFLVPKFVFAEGVFRARGEGGSSQPRIPETQLTRLIRIAYPIPLQQLVQVGVRGLPLRFRFLSRFQRD